MAKKILYNRFLSVISWPAAAEFEDISDDEFDYSEHFSDEEKGKVAAAQETPLDFSFKPLSTANTSKLFGETVIKKEYMEPVKEEPVEYQIKIEPLDQEEGSLVIDTNEDELIVNDERLLLEWNQGAIEQKHDTEDSDESDSGVRKVQSPKSDSIPLTTPVKRKMTENISPKLSPASNSSTEQFNCQFCTRKYWKVSKLKDHIKSYHAKKQKTDQMVTPNKTKLGLKGRRAGEWVTKCPECERQLPTKTDMYVHRLTHIIPSFQTMTCPLCKVSQHTWSNMKVHMQSKHEINEKWFCPICPDGRTFTQNHSLLIHISTFHFDINKNAPAQYHCDKCKKSFTSKALLGKHINSDHNISNCDNIGGECQDSVKMRKLRFSPKKEAFTPRKSSLSPPLLKFQYPGAAKPTTFTISSILSSA